MYDVSVCITFSRLSIDYCLNILVYLVFGDTISIFYYDRISSATLDSDPASVQVG